MLYEWPPSCADTRFATLMLANNETGAIQPVRELVVLAVRDGHPGPHRCCAGCRPYPGPFSRLGCHDSSCERP